MIAEYRFQASTPRNGTFSHLVITSGRYCCFEIGTKPPLLTYFKRVREKDSILAWAISGGEIDQISCWRYKTRRSCNHLPRMKQPIVLKNEKRRRTDWRGRQPSERLFVPVGETNFCWQAAKMRT